MTTVAPHPCPGCGRLPREVEPFCPLCGHLFEVAASETAPRTAVVSDSVVATADPPVLGPVEDPRAVWIWLGLGLVTAPIFSVTPILQSMGWFVSSLVHELGHTAVSWFFGAPAVPTIALDGHAAAFHQGQLGWLVLVVAACLGAAGWRRLGSLAGRALTLGLVALYLGVAFSPLHESLRLLAGHGGEYAIAVVFLWRCATGGFTHSPAERLLYGTLGWFLLGGNLLLSVRLVFSEAARSTYAGSGSFGLTNDYLRLGLPLPLVAGAMGLFGLAVLALVLHVVHPRAEN